MANDASFKLWWAKQERLSGSPGTILAFLRAQREADVRHVLPAIQAPTLVIQRAEDAYRRVEHGRYLAETIPDATYVELPGRDNLPYVGDQDAVLDEVEEFLTGVRPSPEPDRVLATVLFTDIVGATSRAAESATAHGVTSSSVTTPSSAESWSAGVAERWTRQVTVSWRRSTGPLAQSGPLTQSPNVFRPLPSMSGSGCTRERSNSSETTYAGSPYTSAPGRPHSLGPAKSS